MPKAYRAGFLIFVPVFVSREFDVGSKQESTASPVRDQFLFAYLQFCARIIAL